MKNIIGREVLIRADGISFKGIIVEDFKDRVCIKSGDKIIFVIKNKIVFYMVCNNQDVINNDKNNSGLHLFCCFDNNSNDLKKYFITYDFKDIENVKQIFKSYYDLEDSIIVKDYGDLYSISKELLKDVIDGSVYGE